MQGTGNFLQGSNSFWKTASPSSPLFLLLLFSNWCLLLLTAGPLGSPHLHSPNITAQILGQHSIYGISTVPPEILGILCSQTPETMTVKIYTFIKQPTSPQTYTVLPSYWPFNCRILTWSQKLKLKSTRSHSNRICTKTQAFQIHLQIRDDTAYEYMNYVLVYRSCKIHSSNTLLCLN